LTHRTVTLCVRDGSPYPAARTLTKCTLIPNSDDLIVPDCAELVINSLLWAANESWIRLLGFVVMPDHCHVNLGLGEVKTLSQVMESIGKFTARRINLHLGREGPFWEEGFYDHMIRNREEFGRTLKYIHNNPVAAGLVEYPEDWPYSTANPRYGLLIDWNWIEGMSRDLTDHLECGVLVG
jgi:REP element-mobilizing transposase RayT